MFYFKLIAIGTVRGMVVFYLKIIKNKMSST